MCRVIGYRALRLSEMEEANEALVLLKQGGIRGAGVLGIK